VLEKGATMNLRLISIALILSVGLVGCAGRQLEEAKTVTPDADPHNAALYEGYIDLSQMEYDEGDYVDSDFFAERAMAVAAGENVEPQMISARDLGESELNQAAADRRRVIVALFNGADQTHPREAAQAQVGFDCWMQEQEEGFQPDDIAACRERFETAMKAIGEGATVTVTKTEAKSDNRLTFDVFFDFDSDALSDDARIHLSRVAQIIEGYANPVVAVIGNADQVGSADYNLDLSQRRADNVAETLRGRGVEIDGVFARGDQVPQLDTLDRSPQELNRRVVITVREE